MRERLLAPEPPASARRERLPRPPLPRLDKAVFHIQDVPRLGGPSRSTLYRMIAAGKLHPVRIGSRTFLRGDHVRALLGYGAEAGHTT